MFDSMRNQSIAKEMSGIKLKIWKIFLSYRVTNLLFEKKKTQKPSKNVINSYL